MKRIIYGTLGGTLFGGFIAFALPSVLFLISYLFVNTHPADRRDDLESFPILIGFCTACGVIIGGLAGFASHVPENGVPFLRCCLAIAIPTVFVRILTAPRPKISEENQFYASYIASLATLIIATGVLIAIGCKKSHTLHTD